MALIISCSARTDGNCGAIARHIAAPEDTIIHLFRLDIHPCSGCAYECFTGECPHASDAAEQLYAAMAQAESTVLIVPMYCGHPSSLYFAWHERGQGYFMRHPEDWKAVICKVRVIAVYGSEQETPGYLRGFDDWFEGNAQGRVLGLERHRYHQRMADSLLDVPEVRRKLDEFMQEGKESP